MNKKAIFAEDLLAEIERQEGLLGRCDRLEVDNVKAIISDFPAVELLRFPADGIRTAYALAEVSLAFEQARDAYLEMPVDVSSHQLMLSLNNILATLLQALNGTLGHFIVSTSLERAEVDRQLD